MTPKEIEKDVQRIMKKHDFFYEWGVYTNGDVEFDVQWGDWKHDHGFLTYIMQEYGYKQVREVITEEDGSDCYSSIHTFKYVGKNN